MEIEKKHYRERLIDSTLNDYLQVAKAVLIVGPKWCGKTWTSSMHSNSVVSMTDTKARAVARIDPTVTLMGESPRLIDEWQEVPALWDKVRTECDSSVKKGRFILTGSTTLLSKSDDDDEMPKHSGIGRIVTLRMSTMTLWESGDSQDLISLEDMKNGNEVHEPVDEIGVLGIANLIVRGGFPENIDIPTHLIDFMPNHYIDALAYIDILKEGKDLKSNRLDSRKMVMLLRSLARNESTLVNDSKILTDIKADSSTEKEEDRIKSLNTLKTYMNVLQQLNVVWYQEMFDCNYRSRKRVGGKAKIHLADPSLAAAALGMTPKIMLNDLNTMGFLFEALVERDLRAYMDYYRGNLYHFRDSATQEEVDAIVEFRDGEYGAIEIKLGPNQIDKAKESLMVFYENVQRKPTFMCVIVGFYPAVIRDPETGIYIVPISALGLHRDH